jgi:hypothetical protein
VTAVRDPSELDRTIEALAPTTLGEVERVAPLDIRIERKYIVTPEAATAVLRAHDDRVQSLDISRRRTFGYETLYFDTDDLASYHGSVHGRRRRYKVRTRTYLHHGASVLEVKTKTANGRTTKHRLPSEWDDRHRLTVPGRAFVDRCIGVDGLGDSLHQVLTTTYRRSTIMHGDDGSRVTFDRDVACTDQTGGHVGLGGFVVLETKAVTSATAIDRWLWHHGLRPTRISKFGVGMAALHPGLPANRWNRVLRQHFAWEPTDRSG